MIHYTCDRCKRTINTASQVRYIVQIDVQMATDDNGCDFEEDIDQLSELHQVLEGMAEEDLESVTPETSHRGQYDLCANCHQQFIKNPLARDAVLPLGFSNN